ncbi:MAG: hypothetical protein KC731_01020, partial [Myxococcales bacterium]|nr:hypothetical protein [Myxococcales bacterium]
MRHLTFLLTSCLAGGCVLFDAFDGDYGPRDQADPSPGGSEGSGGETASTTGGAGGGSSSTGTGGEGGELTCVDTCASGRCEGELCVPWAQSFGGTGMSNARHVTTADDGGVIVAGDFDGSLTIGATTLWSKGDRDAFVAAFSRQGDFLWARSFGGSWYDEVTGIDTGPGGAIYLTLRCQDVDFPPLGHYGLAGGEDICVAKLDGMGVPQWAQSFGSPMWEQTWGLATTSEGVFIAGELDTSLTIGNTTLTAPTKGGFVARLALDTGIPIWARSVDSPNWISVQGIAAAPNGHVDVVGTYTTSVTVGGITLYDEDGWQDIYVARLSPTNGNAQWAKRLRTVNSNGAYGWPRGIASRDDATLVVGAFDGSWDFGGGPVTSSGTQGAVVALGDGGSFAWQRALSGSGFSELTSVTTSP